MVIKVEEIRHPFVNGEGAVAINIHGKKIGLSYSDFIELKIKIGKIKFKKFQEESNRDEINS